MKTVTQTTVAENTHNSPQQETLKLTWNEIARHNRPEDCWIVIDGNVYDLTEWVDQHPGGSIITLLAGEDASAIFHSYHLRDITPMLNRFRIGEVDSYSPSFEIINDPFLVTLKTRVLEYFERERINYRDTKRNQRKIVFTSLLLFLCWVCMYLLPPWGYLAAIPMGLATCSLIGSFGHEYSHGNLFTLAESKGWTYQLRINMLWGLLIPFMPERFFRYEHIKHHLHPMNPETDYDVYALSRFIRLSHKLELKRYQSGQHLYAPFVYGIYIFLQIIGGYTTSFFDKVDNIKTRRDTINDTSMALVAFVFHLAIPFYLTGFWWVLLCAGTYFFTWQAAIYFTSGVPHMTDSAANCSRHTSWAYHVCKTTSNLKCGNRFFDWLTGGLNYHLVHHLLPSLPRDHLAAITPIVEQTCKDFNYPFNTYTSFIAYYRDHYKFLYELGRTITPSTLHSVRAAEEKAV